MRGDVRRYFEGVERGRAFVDGYLRRRPVAAAVTAALANFPAANHPGHANDAHPEREAVKVVIEGAKIASHTSNRTATPEDAAEIARLAALSPIEYDRKRKSAAERLGIRTETLDTEVRRVRGEAQEEAIGEAVLFPRLEPWPEPVNGAGLLDEIAEMFRRYIVLPSRGTDACALWTLATHLPESVQVAPILAAVSPEKRCGKTTLLALLGRLCRRPLSVANITPAALFRSVEQWQPTLLIDELDAFLGENNELRGVLNSGHSRDTAFVIRTVGDDYEPRRFATWGFKALALIGHLPDTLTDRAIVIELHRKMPSERVEKLRQADAERFQTLARKCQRFARDHAEAVRAARPQIPEELNDRAADNWEPLFAIADAAGGPWPKLAREAAKVLSGATPDGDSLKVELLRNIQALLTGRPDRPSLFADREVISSAELVEALAADKEWRWSEFSRGRPLNQRQLARMLRAFRLVSSTVRLDDGSTPKGYKVKAFAEPFRRYLPPFEAPHRHMQGLARVVADPASATEEDLWRFGDPPQASIGAGCGGVADENPGIGEGERF
jgi:putative DNA primase/helicase